MTTKKTFKERLRKPRKQWIKAIVWCFIYLLFIIWLGNYVWLWLMPFIFDAFITDFIPWTWWKTTKNKTLRSFMSWVDAIVFALIAVFLINNYLFQNYQIPTSSLEKTLLVGDFLAVSKATYGPRVPMTPLSFPLVQNTFPVINTKSYFEKPQVKYRRLKGLAEIKRNDIVVFNFPAGDTIAFKIQNPDYYTICYSIGKDYVSNVLKEEPTPELCYHYGREFVKNNPDRFGEVMYRPVDRRENYVKRCVGIAGDTLQIIDKQIYINGEPQEHFEGIQYNYYVQTDGYRISNTLKDKLEISNEDFESLNNQAMKPVIEYMGLDANMPIYNLPLTQKSYEILKNHKNILKIVDEPDPSWLYETEDYPLGLQAGWTRDNYGPIFIPKKGSTIELNRENYLIYERVIRNYEGNKLEMKDDVYYINDKIASEYTFQMDYYWMMGDNRHKSADSRSWGFVPEDHIVGRPMFVWLSLNKDKSLFGGKIRFNRFFKNARR